MNITFSPSEIDEIIQALRKTIGIVGEPERRRKAIADKILSAYPPLELTRGDEVCEEVPEIEEITQ